MLLLGISGVSGERKRLPKIPPITIKDRQAAIAPHHEDLEKSFTEEQKETFEKFHDCWSEYMSLGEAAIFTYAFKLGMQIAIETLTE